MRVSRARVVVLVCVSNVTVATVSTVLYYRELFILAAAPQFTMQINAAIQCTVSGAGLVCLDLSGLAPRRRQAPVRMRVWLGLAALFVLQNTLEISAIDGLGPDNGSLTTVIQQAVIPITLLISASLLGKSYGRLHWIAAAAVTAGVVASQRFGGPVTTSLQWGWAWALLVSRVPAAAANVLSEAVLAPPGPSPRAWPQLRSVLRATFWTGLFALPLNLPSNLAVSALRGLPPLHAVRDDYSTGALCLLRETGCSGAAAAVLAFAVPGTLFAAFEFATVQQAGAAVYFLLAALQLPLVAAALSAPALMGHLASTFHPSLLWGLPLTVSGITLWAFAEQRREAAAHGQASAAADGEGEGDAPRLAPRVTSALLNRDAGEDPALEST